MEPHWAYLPAVALDLILDRLVEQVDHTCFGAVCKNWRTIAKLYHQNNESGGKLLPMLLVRTKRKWRRLYGIATKREYPFQLPPLLPRKKRKFCGSSHGWIATVDCHNVVTLFNPFKNADPIALPPLEQEPEEPRFKPRNVWNVDKVTLSADPATSPDDHVVAALYDKCSSLAFIKAGQKSWSCVDHWSKVFADIAFYKGLFYALQRDGGIVSFDIRYFNDPSGNERIAPNNVSPADFRVHSSVSAYLVKSLEGDLWTVQRFASYRGLSRTGTRCFTVYKLELDAQNGSLLHKLRLESLGDNVLFVGINDSISLSASYFSGCLQKDSIYFTNDVNDYEGLPYHAGAFDLGFYNVKDGSFGEHYPYNRSFRSRPASIWVLPPS